MKLITLRLEDSVLWLNPEQIVSILITTERKKPETMDEPIGYITRAHICLLPDGHTVTVEANAEDLSAALKEAGIDG